MVCHGLYKRIVLNLLIIVFFLFILLILYHVSIYHKPWSPILGSYRVVRVSAVVLSGIVLGFTGTYLQGCLRNPLVDHYILGIGSGALFAVYLSIYILGYNVYLASLTAIIGGLTALAITTVLAESIGGSDSAYVLAGLGVNSLFSGLSILFIYLVASKYPYAVYLLIGSFITASSKQYPLLFLAIAMVLIVYPFIAKPLNTLILGDEYAKQLGYSPRTYRLLAVIVSGIASSLIVSCYGLIGFIGLLSPHIARFTFKTIDHRIVSPLSAIISAIILLLTDDFTRIFLSEYVGEIPAGAIVSVFGAPFFLALILTRFKRGLR